MDEATQQNAALVEEATAAARAMEEQARELTETIAVFKIDDAPAPVAASRRQAISAPATTTVVKAPVATTTRAVRSAPKRVASGGGSDTSWHEF